MIVKFDGKHISFPVNGIKIVDGEFPSFLAVDTNECYQIDAGSLASLVAFINEKKIVEIETHDLIGAEHAHWGSSFACFRERDICRIFSRDSYVIELVQKLEKKGKELADIKRVVENHNKQPWYKRINRIAYKPKE